MPLIDTFMCLFPSLFILIYRLKV